MSNISLISRQYIFFPRFKKAPVPSVECPVCNIQLSSQVVYISHIAGKAHKKKLIIQAREKSKGTTKDVTGFNRIAEDNVVLKAASDNVVKAIPSSSSESIIMVLPESISSISPTKKKKKNKVNSFNQ